jgi:hypothetical protein
MKRLFLAALALAPAIAAAQNIHYVDNHCSMNGNGASGYSACASAAGGNGPWNSLAALSCSGVAAGDHIQLRKGTGSYREQNGGGYYSVQPPAACSGASAGAGSASTPVYFENYPGEDVFIDGSLDIKSSTWTAQGGGVYKCTAGTCAPAHSGAWAWIAWWTPAAGGTEQEIYAVQSATCDSTIPAGFMYVNGSSGPCVHLPDGTSPASSAGFSIPYVHNGMTLANGNSVHDFTIRRNPSGGSLTIRRHYFDSINGSYTSNYNLTIDGLDVGFNLNRCIDIDNANFPASYPIKSSPQHDTFTHNHIHHCGQEGIHMGDDTLVETFTFNEVDHVQIPPWFQYCGSSGSVPGGSKTCGPNFTDRGVAVRAWCFASSLANSCVISNNIIHDSGGAHQWGRMGGVHFEYGAQNILVENNLIYNLGPLGSHQYTVGAGATAFQMNQFGSYPGCNNCTFRNNRIYNVDDCWNFENGGAFNMNLYNNTCANFSDAVLANEYGTNTGTINLVNNIFYWSPTADRTSGPGAGFVGGGGFSVSTTFANNSFYCTTGCTGTIVDFPTGTTYTAATISAVGNNTWGDPKISFATTGLPYDRLGTTGGTGPYAPWNAYKLPVPALYLMSASGSAYHLGQALIPSFADFLGAIRPASGAWDIGASVLTATPPAINAPTVTRH